MRLFIGDEQYELNDSLLSAIVRAIDKAISVDIPNQLRENPLETNNYIHLMRGDWINQNLCDFAVADGSVLLSFKRFSWKGRILVNHESRLTISITTQNNLLAIQRKTRRRPHYLQSVLHVLNGDLHGHYEQIPLFGLDLFDKEAYAEDFTDIISGAFDPAEGYRHCVVAYSTDGDELIDIRLVVFDPWWFTVAEESLKDYLKPDFARLSESTFDNDQVYEDHNSATRRLTSLKLGVKTSLRETQKEG